MALGTSFMEDSFSKDWGVGVGVMVMQVVGAAINAGETLLSCGSHPALQPGS